MTSVSASLKLAEQHLCALRYDGGLSRKPKEGWVVHKTNDVMREFSNLTKERERASDMVGFLLVLFAGQLGILCPLAPTIGTYKTLYREVNQLSFPFRPLK